MDRRTFMQQAVAGAGLGVLAGSKNVSAQQNVTEPFTFAVIADPHCGEDAKQGLEEYGKGIDKLLLCLEQIDAIEGTQKPDFLLLLGDIHPWILKDHQDRINLPVHAVAGNHEATKERRQELRDLFPDDFKNGNNWRDYYSFVHKGMRFIGLCDAGKGGEHVGQFCSEIIKPSGQCEWLEAQLEEPEARKVIFAHIPTEPEGKDRNMYMSRNDARWFNALVTAKKPEAMFFGHLHQKTREYPIGSTRAINVRSCCWNFGESPIGYMLVDVTAEGMKIREVDIAEYA